MYNLKEYLERYIRWPQIEMFVKMGLYHSKYMKMGDIPSYAYQNFCEMYEAYHELGGNGMVTKMKQEIEELHIKRKGE